MTSINETREAARLQADRERTAYWKRWGPYLSERQWGTVREDYSHDGEAWNYFTHDQARSRAYRWGEDGLGGVSDTHQRLCFALALWNGQDPFLKERLFGLTGSQGNHGEDVKDYYFYLDSTPTHSYLKFLYKYPQRAFPYDELLRVNQQRNRHELEYELLDTGVFDDDRYFDVFIEYAKATDEDILIQIQVMNRGPEAAEIHLLPTLWFRNDWSWNSSLTKPILQPYETQAQFKSIAAHHRELGSRWLYAQDQPELLFTENETNHQRLFGSENQSPYVKDAFHDYVTQGQITAINPDQVGTKMATYYHLRVPAQGSVTVRLRLCNTANLSDPFGPEFDQIWRDRLQEADDFYRYLIPETLDPDLKQIQRQAFAGMLWSKQYYHYVVDQWLSGDQQGPKPPVERLQGRNHDWVHLFNDDILSMPDKWEYPWFAAWDLAFHCIPLAMVDPEFAKRQLDIMTREWYMHPNGQLPAYEWNFGDVNPPVHAWATLAVYRLEAQLYGRQDRAFLERVFQKLLLNFTWWVNRKDTHGKNIFEGGFLGLDNIGVFNRSAALPTGGFIEQADGTSWMGMYCLNMLSIALELALENPVYEDIASKFFEHFLYIAAAMNQIGEDNKLWDPEDGFFYDVLSLPDGTQVPLKVRSMIGLIPLYGISILEPEVLKQLPNFKKRLEWFIHHRADLKVNVACMETQGIGARRLLALCYLTPHRWVEVDRFRQILIRLLDEQEFLSEFGIRALSKYHANHPYSFYVGSEEYRVDYEPAESWTALFGGNSNWRGPIWMPVNYLLIESLKAFYNYAGDTFKVECPTGSGHWLTLAEVAQQLEERLLKIFRRNEVGRRPLYGGSSKFQTDPHWRDYILFHEYFHGDNGAGLGASHQTGWTGLIAKIIYDLYAS